MARSNAILEVCVDTMEGLLAAKSGGADRIELCSSLSEGGLTPSAGMMRAAASLDIPCYAMIRPRGGDFRYSEREIAIMLDDIAQARDAGLHGVVFGAERANTTLDRDSLLQLMVACDGLGTTLHRVIDCVDDIWAALEDAIALGFDRILTSGGASDAVVGVSTIAEMISKADGRIIVMPGGGLRPQTILEVADLTGAAEFHASCRVQIRRPERHFFDPKTSYVTDTEMVSAMKQKLLQQTGP